MEYLSDFSGSSSNDGSSPLSGHNLHRGNRTRTFLEHLPPDVVLLTMFVSAVSFAVLFLVSWIAMKRHWAVHFDKMTRPVQADTVARVGSSAHTIIVVPMLLYFLFSTVFNEKYEPAPHVPGNSDPYHTVQISFCITVGYFVTDGILTFAFRMPSWPIFLLHHVLASSPYIIFLLTKRCAIGSYILAGFMVVETTNVPLNMQVMLERSGRADTQAYANWLYTTLFLWIVTRVYGPIDMVYIIHMHVWKHLTDQQKQCLYFSVCCAWFIVVFCLYAFVFVLLAEVRSRWQKTPEPREVAHLDETRALKVDPHVPITDDEIAVTSSSPTHVAIYNARKGLFEVEDAVEKCLHPSVSLRNLSDGGDGAAGAADDGGGTSMVIPASPITVTAPAATAAVGGTTTAAVAASSAGGSSGSIAALERKSSTGSGSIKVHSRTGSVNNNNSATEGAVGLSPHGGGSGGAVVVGSGSPVAPSAAVILGDGVELAELRRRAVLPLEGASGSTGGGGSGTVIKDKGM